MSDDNFYAEQAVKAAMDELGVDRAEAFKVCQRLAPYMTEMVLKQMTEKIEEQAPPGTITTYTSMDLVAWFGEMAEKFRRLQK